MHALGQLALLNLVFLARAFERINVNSHFVVPTEVGTNVEFYDLATMRLGIHLDRVSFQVAKEICAGRNGTLLEYVDEELADFVAQALGESAAGTSLWIGGEYTPATDSEQGVWKWLSGENIMKESIPKDTRFPMQKLPYWVDRPDLNSREPACLITDRNDHRRPLITGLPCWVKRPFVCTVATISMQIVNPTELYPPVSTEKGRTFHLYHAETTWMEALNLCRDMGFSLAVVDKQDEFIKLEHRMRRVRPIMENAWISGAFLNDKWVWASTNEEIATKTTANMFSLPPWYRPDNITMDGCLLADRHICDYFVYVEARCDRRRNFICHEESTKPQDPLLKVPGSSLYMSTIKLPWLEAERQCQRCLTDGTLLQLAFHSKELLTLQVNWLVKAMTVLTGQEIRHIWLNAHLYNDTTFRWGNNRDMPIVDNRYSYDINPRDFSNSSDTLLKANGEDGFIIFCPGDFKTDPYLKNYKCLNMDRENIRNFYMYGLSCEYRQHFFCMVKDGNGPTVILEDTCKRVHIGVGAAHLDENKFKS